MKRVIVFGATGGIGQEISRKLANEGWSIYLHYNQQKALANKLALELGTNYQDQEFYPFQLDLAVGKNYSDFFKDFLRIDALVFAQGITDYVLFGQQESKKFDQILRVNLIEPLKIVKYFEPELLKGSHSRIIFIGSVYGKNGSALETAYSTTKGALSSFTSAYAKEVAAANVTVNVLAPGAIMTPMTASFSDEELEQLQTEIPAGRLGTPRDISYWIAVMISPDADYFTGQTVFVDGGWLV